MRRAIGVAGIAVMLLFPTRGAGAQVPEVRIDAIFARRSAVHAGLGATVATGTYLRTGFTAALGGGTSGVSGRVDVFSRFHLDPFRESRWAPYAGGGLSARFDDGEHSRAYLLFIAGVDGPAKRGLTTSFEAGFGGGGRIGVVIRRAAAERR